MPQQHPSELVICLDVWDPRRGGLEFYADELVTELAKAGSKIKLVCGECPAAKPVGDVELVVLHCRGPSFYRALDAKAGEGGIGAAIAFRHPGRTAKVFLPLGGLFQSSLDARRRAEPRFLRLWKAAGRRLSAKTRFYLARERAFFAAPCEDRLVLASSERVACDIREAFPRFAGRVEVTGLPVDEARFVPPKAQERERLRKEIPGIEDADPVLLWVGNEPRRKGLKAAIAVLRRFRSRKMNARLVLAGHGSERYHRKEPGLIGLGYTDLLPLYRAADLLIAPSLEDNLSFSVLEALACGLPVVTTRKNGASMYLEDERLGRVVDEPRDIHALDGAALALCHKGALSQELMERRRQSVRSCFKVGHFARMRSLLGLDRSGTMDA